MQAEGYSLLARVLHHLALSPGVCELSYNLDQGFSREAPEEWRTERHVFVSGLARAGTTVLLRRFHETGLFRSLTYRDMPFVLAPNLWRRLVSKSGRDLAEAERAHGDSVLVDADSPESFDEVFWRVFFGDAYIEKSRLRPHVPPGDIVQKYVKYVAAVLSAQDEPRKSRYLCKNNNNILRLDALYRAFPRAVVLIPFRDPLQHAFSLMTQHVRFREMQGDDAFVRAYMGWLGHFEFGLDHRPSRFNDGEDNPYPARTLDHWLWSWSEVYGWLLKNGRGAPVFVCYEDLCASDEAWRGLAALAEIPTSATAVSHTPLQSRNRSVDVSFERQLAERAQGIYNELAALSRTQIGIPG